MKELHRIKVIYYENGDMKYQPQVFKKDINLGISVWSDYLQEYDSMDTAMEEMKKFTLNPVIKIKILPKITDIVYHNIKLQSEL